MKGFIGDSDFAEGESGSVFDYRPVAGGSERQVVLDAQPSTILDTCNARVGISPSEDDGSVCFRTHHNPAVSCNDGFNRANLVAIGVQIAVSGQIELVSCNGGGCIELER